MTKFTEAKAARALLMLQLIAKGHKPSHFDAKEISDKAEFLMETEPGAVKSAMNYLNHILEG